MRNKIPQIVSMVAISSSTVCSSFAQTVDLKSFEGVSPTITEKLRELRRQAKFGDIDGKSIQFKIFEKEVLGQITKIEESQKMSTSEADSIAKALSALADIHSPAILTRQSNVQPDDVFAVANSYKLRALKVLDKAHSDKNSLVENHRALLNWYLDRKRTKEVAEQTKTLSELLNSTDPKILNPNRRILCGRSVLMSGPYQDYDCGMG